MTRVEVALFNFRGGGRRPDRSYDFSALQDAFRAVETPPALILLCEARGYRDQAGAAKYAAAEALSDQLGVPYVAEIGSVPRGPLPPAIFYNPDILVLRSWWQPDDPGVFDDQRNVARFAVRDSATISEPRTEFLTFVHHFEPLSGDARMLEARRLARYGHHQRLPVIGGGDLNATASGEYLPQRDWTAVPVSQRPHKGILDPDGNWAADTRAVDYLIGVWDHETRQRRDGCGFQAIADMHWLATKEPVAPTVNPGVDAGGGLLIDWLLVNDLMAPHVVAGSYRVHIPDPDRPPPSDHRLVTATVDLAGVGSRW